MPAHKAPELMTIAQLSPAADQRIGDYIYRIRQPAEFMAAIHGVSVVNLTNTCPHLQEICLAADVLVLHLIGEHNLLPLAAERKRLGLPTVFEISDNFLALPAWVPFRRWFLDPANLATTFQLIRTADAAQGVSAFLLERFAFLQDRRMVFENQVLEPPPLKPRGEGPVVIGWAGSLGHTRDIARIAPAIRDLCRRREDVQFAFMGNREQYDQVFGSDSLPVFSYRGTGSLQDYYVFLEGLDIGLAPLEDEAYNLCRSDVKFIEYASRGAVPVVSDLEPYRAHVVHGENGFLYRSPESLTKIIESLLDDPALMRRTREAAYRYVTTERLEERHAHLRVDFYRGLMERPDSRPFPWHLVEKEPGPFELYAPKTTKAETILVQGATAAGRGDSREALACWARAATELPGYELAHICEGRSKAETDEEGAIACFRKALSANPRSLLARLLLGRILGRKRADEARKVFEEAIDVFPDFAPAWHELGLMEWENGNAKRAIELLNRALEVNPFYADAACALGGVLRAEARYDTALQAVGVALDLIPSREDYHVALIDLLAAMGRPEAAAEAGLSFLKMNPESVRIREALQDLTEQETGEQRPSRA